VDSGGYYGLPENRRDAYAQGITRVAAPAAVLLMAGFTKIPGLIPGISEDDLRRRRLKIRRFELSRTPT